MWVPLNRADKDSCRFWVKIHHQLVFKPPAGSTSVEEFLFCLLLWHHPVETIDCYGWDRLKSIGLLFKAHCSDVIDRAHTDFLLSFVTFFTSLNTKEADSTVNRVYHDSAENIWNQFTAETGFIAVMAYLWSSWSLGYSNKGFRIHYKDFSTHFWVDMLKHATICSSLYAAKKWFQINVMLSFTFKHKVVCLFC